ncbi:hypothetical protein ACF0H5_017401 [Mactra antiquata]
MPGSSPATPNLSMDMCQRQASSRQMNVTFTGKHAEYINDWCTKYDKVLPCMDRVLPSANSASDWYLKLIYDQEMATRMSKSICARFPYLSNLTCVESDMMSVGKCMQWTTASAIDRFFGQFTANEPLTTPKKKMASIYACIISVATAGCFHKELLSCSKPQRKLMYDFYIMMSGNCREIAGLPETTTIESVVTTSMASTTTRKNDKTESSTPEQLQTNYSTEQLPRDNSVEQLETNNTSTTHAPPEVTSERPMDKSTVKPFRAASKNGVYAIVSDFKTVFLLASAYILLLK